jgi:hypothetical protein
MQDDLEIFSRRHFLQWSTAASIALAGTSRLSADTGAEAAPVSARTQPPQHTVMLRSADLEVALDAVNGLPYSYRLTQNNATLRGEDLGKPAVATICRLEPWSFATFSVTPHHHSARRGEAVFHFLCSYSGSPAAQFSIRYKLQGATLVVSMEDIQENYGFQLIDLEMPRLVTVRHSDNSAWLVHGDEGGSFCALQQAKSGKLPLNRFWGNVQGTLPVVMLGTADAMCVQETTAFMDGTLLSVMGEQEERLASIGTDKVHRVNGSACYDLNLGKGKALNCGNQTTPNLLVEQPSSCRLDFFPVSGEPAKAWITAGRTVRNRMPAIPNTFYNDKFVYGIRCDQPNFSEPSATFEQCRQLIGRIAALTDNSPQIVHLWGWQFRGKDTGYPAVNVVDARIGGHDAMMKLMKEGEALNATVTLSDNYDDAYRSSPAWNPEYIARRPDGQLWESRAWTGERSYILGLAKYMSGPGPDRIRYTCERYKLKHTTHLDVLSYYSIRNDWDRQHPASGISNLVDGRYKVLQGFAAHGVDVSSEALRYPMIGHISSYWYLSGPGSCPFGGTNIPLIPLIYGNSAVWGLSGKELKGDPAVTRILERIYGARPQSIIRADTEPAHYLDAFYLGMVPFFLLRGRNLQDFERNGTTTRIVLEGDALIESNLNTKQLRIALGDADVLRNDAAFCPLGEDRIACYAITPQKVRVKLPARWGGRVASAATLFPDHREVMKVHTSNGSVELALGSRRPVILYRV